MSQKNSENPNQNPQLSASPDRGSFQIDCELKQVEEGTKTLEQAQEMIGFYKKWQDNSREREAKPEWQENNMEYDLRTTDWILEKVRASESYAQNLYAAICNNDFQKIDVFPILAGQTCSYSWRYAGGIVADMRQEGDYIDWYCSGIKGNVTDEEFQAMDKESQEQYLYAKNNFVNESCVTDEIRDDLLKLGWSVVTETDNAY